MDALLGLLGFAFVSSVTPGPNNVMLWASGAAFGVPRTLRHVLGTAIGLGAMALAVAAGIGALITAYPALAVAMKIGGSLYLLYLAVQIARSSGLQPGTVARPLGLVEAAGFQAINPKAWVFALGAITTFRPPGLPLAAGSLVVAVAMMAVIVPTALLWASAGGALSRLLTGARTRRVVSLVLALTVAATVAWVWA
jgi:threonine/homoserine/homoserine lactone efflux protein